MFNIGFYVNAKGAIDRLRRLSDMEKILPATKIAAVRIRKVFEQLTPVSKPPDVDPQRGRMRRSWRSEGTVVPSQKRALIVVKNVDPRVKTVWPFLIKGTRRHLIRARSAKALVFLMRNRQMFYGKQVNHPGFRSKVDARRLKTLVDVELSTLKKTILKTLVAGRPTSA